MSVLDPTSGSNRVMSVPHARDGVQRRRALCGQLVGAAQVDHGGHADIAHELGDVGRRQLLQVVRAQQPGPRGLLPILGGQVAKVTHVDRTIKLNPRHDNTFADPPPDGDPAVAEPRGQATTRAKRLAEFRIRRRAARRIHDCQAGPRSAPPHLLLHPHRRGNLEILHRPEVSCRDPAGREIVARLQQPLRAQQAAHMVGAERRAGPA
jgi:hypothetical protein